MQGSFPVDPGPCGGNTCKDQIIGRESSCEGVRIPELDCFKQNVSPDQAPLVASTTAAAPDNRIGFVPPRVQAESGLKSGQARDILFAKPGSH
jgi:hypothetical protein